MIYCWVPSDSSLERSSPPPFIVRGILETRTSKFWRSFFSKNLQVLEEHFHPCPKHLSPWRLSSESICRQWRPAILDSITLTTRWVWCVPVCHRTGLRCATAWAIVLYIVYTGIWCGITVRKRGSPPCNQLL